MRLYARDGPNKSSKAAKNPPNKKKCFDSKCEYGHSVIVCKSRKTFNLIDTSDKVMHG